MTAYLQDKGLVSPDKLVSVGYGQFRPVAPFDTEANRAKNRFQEPQPEEKYRKYDFYSPKKYTKDKLKMLQSIYDNYSRIATSQINGLFHVASEVEVVGVEEQRYYEFGNALNETDIMTLAKVELQDGVSHFSGSHGSYD